MWLEVVSALSIVEGGREGLNEGKRGPHFLEVYKMHAEATFVLNIILISNITVKNA